MTTALLLCDGLPDVQVRISTLPGQDLVYGLEALQLIESGESEGLAVAPVQLVEESEYTYEVLGVDGPISLEPAELFSSSDDTGLVGRVKTKRATGTVRVDLYAGDVLLGATALEVRSRKLDYLTEYRSMLQRIAEETAEAVQSQFAPSSLRAFSPTVEADAETLYQRFAFIQSVLGSTEFEAAILTVASRPHEEFVAIERSADPRKGLRGSSGLVRQLTRPGPRQLAGAPGGLLASLPVSVRLEDHTQTRDTVPNRFVRHVLTDWRNLALATGDACARKSGPSARRGVIEAAAMARQLEEYLAFPIFRDVSDLGRFPTDNTVLQRRAGYRDIYRAYLLGSASSVVDWEGSLDTFGAGQRDVAALYECWVFLELARIVGSLRDMTIDKGDLFVRSGDQLSLQLARGRPAIVRGSGMRRGSEVALELWFNRSFGPGASWTERLRPDCSLQVSIRRGTRLASRKWLHFDAKYRIDSLRELFRTEEDQGEQRYRPVSADLLKMHAYRDAIRRSSGAYVLYPGGSEFSTAHREWHEILPGLGAFVLRPGSDGHAEPPAEHALRRFLEDAIDHLAADGTDEQRASYWTDRAYDENRGVRVDGFVEPARPPADVPTLLGYIRTPEQLDWVLSQREYNVRADGRRGALRFDSPELAAKIIVLYGPALAVPLAFDSTGTFAIRRADEMGRTGYPVRNQDALYCCIGLAKPSAVPTSITSADVALLAGSGRPPELRAAPRLVDLLQVLTLTGTHEVRPDACE